MAQQPNPSSSTATVSSSGVLYPHLESSIEPLNEDPKYKEIIKIEKELAVSLRDIAQRGNLVEDVSDYNILPIELTTTAVKKRKARSKEDVIKKLNELPNEDGEEEDQQQQEDEEETSDEEQETAADDEEDEAGGDYILSHFDNGEGFEDNDDEGDDGTGVI